jgi:hypothetical protein
MGRLEALIVTLLVSFTFMDFMILRVSVNVVAQRQGLIVGLG